MQGANCSHHVLLLRKLVLACRWSGTWLQLQFRLVHGAKAIKAAAVVVRCWLCIYCVAATEADRWWDAHLIPSEGSPEMLWKSQGGSPLTVHPGPFSHACTYQ